MNLLFITDPLDHFKLEKDTTFAMMQEAVARAHLIHVAQIHQISMEGGRVLVEAAVLTLTGSKDRQTSWYRLHPPVRQPLQNFSAVIMRKDPPFDLNYLYASHLFTLAQAQGAKIFSSGQALRNYNEKLAILAFPELIPPTLVTSEAPRIRAFLNQHQDVIVKPLDGMGGNGIFRIRPDDPNVSVILETITQYGSRFIMAQRTIPEIKEGDKRILMIDGEAVPWCLARIPAIGETRGNLAAGGRGEARELSARDWEIANAVGPELKKRGILLAGLDVIGNYLTEINITSPTCFREIMDQTPIPVAKLYIDALERQCAEA